ncbi:MAG: rhodanese-like domain-containing protein [Opitutales bacterium]
MNKEISVTEAAKLRETDPEVVFLDVREDSELAICRIDGALHIPMGEIPERAESLPGDRPMVVFCHHGMRSANVQQYLEAKGFKNLMNLAGGIHAWSREVDPEVPTY